jgi:DNA-binding MarR family transcriptional regulator
MPHRSDPRLLVLHGLRLKGVAEVGSIAGAVDLSEDVVTGELDKLVAAGLVVRRDGLAQGWSLTDAGRAEHDRGLAAELDAAAARPVVEAGYQRFMGYNFEVLDACSRWQVREVKGKAVRNDHTNATYDARVLADLDAALTGVRPVGEQLARRLERYEPYAPHLDEALTRARAGETEFVAKPLIPSFHTVWFEWHEDLLVTLGRDRSSETVGKGVG